MNPFAVYSLLSLVSLVIGAAIGYWLGRQYSALQVKLKKYTCSTTEVEVEIPDGFFGWIIVEAFDMTSSPTLPPRPSAAAKKIEVTGPDVKTIELTVADGVNTRIRLWGAEAILHHQADCDCPNIEPAICTFGPTKIATCKKT